MKEATPEGLPALLNPSSFRGHVTSDSSKQIPKEVVEGCNPANFPHSLLVSDIHISDQFFLVCKYEVQQNTTLLITCVKKLSSIHFRNLDYLCPVVLPFQQIPGLKSSTRTRACIHELSEKKLQLSFAGTMIYIPKDSVLYVNIQKRIVLGRCSLSHSTCIFSTSGIFTLPFSLPFISSPRGDQP